MYYITYTICSLQFQPVSPRGIWSGISKAMAKGISRGCLRWCLMRTVPQGVSQQHMMSIPTTNYKLYTEYYILLSTVALVLLFSLSLVKQSQRVYEKGVSVAVSCGVYLKGYPKNTWCKFGKAIAKGISKGCLSCCLMRSVPQGVSQKHMM